MRTPVSRSMRWAGLFFAASTLAIVPVAWTQRNENLHLRGEIEQLNRALQPLRSERERLIEQKRRIEAEIRTTQPPSGNFDQTLSAAEHRKRAVVRVIVSLKSEMNQSGVPVAGPPPPPSGPQGNVSFAELLGDPVYASHFVAMTRQQIEERYSPVFAGLNLSPENLGRFKALLVERRVSEEDVRGILTNRELAVNKEVLWPDVYQVQRAVTFELDEKIKEVLGTEGWQKLRAFENGTGARQEFVDALAARLSYSEAPLTATQAGRLVQAYNGSAFLSGRTASPWLAEAFVTAAESILTPGQMVGFRKLTKEMQTK